MNKKYKWSGHIPKNATLPEYERQPATFHLNGNEQDSDIPESFLEALADLIHSHPKAEITRFQGIWWTSGSLTSVTNNATNILTNGTYNPTLQPNISTSGLAGHQITFNLTVSESLLDVIPDMDDDGYGAVFKITLSSAQLKALQKMLKIRRMEDKLLDD